MRCRPIAVLALVSSANGCVIARGALNVVPTHANLVGVDAPGLDAWQADAYSTLDAARTNDAPVSAPEDVYTTPDAVFPRDASTPPDTGCNGADEDGDGLRAPCDPWPCGALPPSIPASVTGSDITISNVSIDGSGNTTVARSGESLNAAMRFVIVDGACTGCIKQIEVGTVPGARSGCIYEGDPPASSSMGGASNLFTMPSVTSPTRVDLRFSLRQDYDCGGNWWGGTPSAPPREPGASQTFGAICVVP